MRVLCCGSRTWDNYTLIKRELERHKPTRVIHGGAYGADRLARRAADELHIQWTEYPADWAKHGKRAGKIRNNVMLKQGKPDLVLAFWDGVSGGTGHMIWIAQRAGLPVVVTYPDGTRRELSAKQHPEQKGAVCQQSYKT